MNIRRYSKPVKTKKNKETYKKARKAKTGDTFPDIEN